MEDNKCFEPDCMLNVEYACTCSSPPVCTCKMHPLNHIESLSDFEEWKNKAKLKTENEISIISSKISRSIEDFDIKFKEEEKIQRNFRNISVEEDLEAKKYKILNNSKSWDLEKELNRSYSAWESDSDVSKTSVTQDYQNIVSIYPHKTSLFNIVEKDNQTNLLIYDTEIESQASIILETQNSLNFGTCIAQLPNGKLFCYGNFPLLGITLLIDENYRVQELPSGIACAGSSAIYFNKNIYCFGGWFNYNYLALSSKFDLDRNQWNELTPLPNADSCCNSIIFNGSILISGWNNKNLLRYSIDSNSFSTIPYGFAVEKRKILINTERLYLIECGENGLIYESEIGSDTAWRQIAINSIDNFTPGQTYFQYNKGEVYIGYVMGSRFCYFKLNLNEKRVIKLV